MRCGECFAIFDAAANLVEGSITGDQDADEVASDDSASAGDATRDSSALDVTYSDFDLFSEDADLPEIAYFDQTRDTPEFDFDSVALEDDETFNDTLFAHDVTIDAGSAGTAVPKTDVLDGDAARQPLEFNYRDPEPDSEPRPDPTTTLLTKVAKPTADVSPERADVQPEPQPDDLAESESSPQDPLEVTSEPVPLEPEPQRGGSVWLIAVLLLGLGALLSALYGWRNRDNLHNDPFARPVYELVCRFTSCTVPTRVSVEELKLTRRNVYSHPDIEDALVIDVTFRNEASFAQRYPSLVVRLSDPSGRTVARRAFLPGEYQPGWRAGDTLGAGGQRNISLDVTDPGENASSFEVEFVPAPWGGSGSLGR